MTPHERQKVSDEASAASEIATLAGYVSKALAADPDTAQAAEALDGIERLALAMGNRLRRFAEVGA